MYLAAGEFCLVKMIEPAESAVEGTWSTGRALIILPYTRIVSATESGCFDRQAKDVSFAEKCHSKRLVPDKQTCQKSKLSELKHGRVWAYSTSFSLGRRDLQ